MPGKFRISLQGERCADEGRMNPIYHILLFFMPRKSSDPKRWQHYWRTSNTSTWM